MGDSYTPDGYVYYVHLIPKELTTAQRKVLKVAQSRVERLYGAMSKKAKDNYDKLPGVANDNDDQRRVKLARELEKVLEGSGNYLYPIGGGTQSSDLTVKNSRFHAEILMLALKGVADLPASSDGLNHGIVRDGEDFINSIKKSFTMGGSQSASKTRWIIVTLYFWDEMTELFRVAARLISFEISAKMEEYIKDGKSTVEGNTTVHMAFATQDWQWITTLLDPDQPEPQAPQGNLSSTNFTVVQYTAES